MGWFIEILYVLAHSKRTQWLITFAFVGCAVIIFGGDYWLANFELHGDMQPAGEAMKNIFNDLYYWGALVWLVSLLGAAAGQYPKDKKRFYASLR